MDEIICDKCSSHNVSQKLVNPKLPNIKPQTMSEYLKKPRDKYGGQITNAVVVYHTYVLECNNCGHKSKEFTE